MSKKSNLTKSLVLSVLISIAAFSSAVSHITKNSLFSELKFTDIGKSIKPGSFQLGNDKLEIKAGGKDVWDKHDEFAFGYKNIKGDFDLSVQIENLSAAHAYTKAGIMARAELNDSSQHVYFQIFPDNRKRNKNNGGCEFQYRMVNGGEMKAIYPNLETVGKSFDVNFPNTWIRLKRTGDIFISYFSADNKNWIQYSSFSLKLPTELFVGLAVTAHDPEKYTTAVFNSFQVTKK